MPSSTERERLIQRYEEGPARLRDAFAQVPSEARKWRPSTDRWSAHEIVCHCADAETNGAARIRFLVAEPEPTIIGYDQNRWARKFDYHSASAELALATVGAVRAFTAQLLRRLDDSAWNAVGTHTESGRYGATDWLRIYAEHLENHSGQIEKNLALWRQEETRPRQIRS